MSHEYVHGSAARTIEKEQPRIKRAFYTEAPIKRAKEKTVQWTPLYAIMLFGVGILFMAVVLNNVKLSAEISALRDEKGNLTEEYEALILENDLYYNSIMGQVDLQEIERIAVTELGMTMAEPGQIVEYSGDMEDYVKQYNDLPTP